MTSVAPAESIPIAGQPQVAVAPAIATAPPVAAGVPFSEGVPLAGQPPVAGVMPVATAPPVATALAGQPPVAGVMPAAYPGQAPGTMPAAYPPPVASSVPLPTADGIPTAAPVAIGSYDVGNTLVLPDNVTPGMQLMIQSPQGAFVIVAPPNAKPGMQLEMPPMNIPTALPVMTYDDMPAEVAYKTHDKCNITVVLNKQGACRAGDNMNGKIVIVAKEQFKARKVTFKLECLCRASWTETRTDSDGNTHRERRHRNRSLDAFATHLFEGPVLEEGTHEFPFDFGIPVDLPPTMAGWGHRDLRYSVVWRFVVNVDRPWAFDVTLKQEILVKSCGPQPHMLAPFISSQEIPVKICCFGFGEIQVELSFGSTCAFEHVPGGYLTGLLSLKATNSSTKPVNSIKFALRERVHVFSQGDTDSFGSFGDSSLAIPAKVEGGEPTTVEKIMVVRFPLPRKPSSVNSTMTVTHYIEVTMDIPWCPDPSTNIPIYIY